MIINESAMKFRIIFILVFLLVFFSCNPQKNPGHGVAWAPDSFESNGQRIYFTATSDRGAPITYNGGPGMRYMMVGDRLACVSCHGINAKGGKHPMHGEVMDAPDIRWESLAGHHHEEESSGESAGQHHDEDTMEVEEGHRFENKDSMESEEGHHHEESMEQEEGHHHENYGFEDFKNAVENGRHPDGDKLDENMPRWKMSDQDLRDLMEFLREQ